MTIDHTAFMRLIVGIPIFLMGILVFWLKRHRDAESSEIKAVLQRRSK